MQLRLWLSEENMMRLQLRFFGLHCEKNMKIIHNKYCTLKLRLRVENYAQFFVAPALTTAMHYNNSQYMEHAKHESFVRKRTIFLLETVPEPQLCVVFWFNIKV
jgi:hypothetical protein